MVRITKVYTKTGDDGQTGLVGGHRIPKIHPRIEAYGTVDELNSLLGLVASHVTQKDPSIRRDKLHLILQAIQQKLFDLGAELATRPGDEYQGQVKINEADSGWLECIIDAMNAELPALRSFILPGGSPLNAHLHLARTVCRRAEREILRLHQTEAVSAMVIAYVNRLSDLLFVMGRWVGATLDETEVLWEVGKDKPDDWKWN